MAQEIERIPALEQALSELGLSELEERLYMTSLSLGPSNMTALAECMQISRPNIYKVIRGLEKRGLATFIGGKKYIKSFQVEPPTMVMERLRQKREDLSKIDTSLSGELPDLIAKYEQGRGPSNVRVLRGKKEFVDAYVKVFEESQKEILYFGSYADFLREIGPDLGERRIARRVERGLSIRGLLIGSPEAESLAAKDENELREIRFLSTPIPFTTSFYLFGNKIILWQPMTPLAIQIEDAYLMPMWRAMFEMLWEKSAK